MILPYKLTPHLISLTGFQDGRTDFSAEILLGTGHKGSKRMKHTTAQSALQRLTSHRDQVHGGAGYIACVGGRTVGASRILLCRSIQWKINWFWQSSVMYP